MKDSERSEMFEDLSGLIAYHIWAGTDERKTGLLTDIFIREGQQKRGIGKQKTNMGSADCREPKDRGRRHMSHAEDRCMSPLQPLDFEALGKVCSALSS